MLSLRWVIETGADFWFHRGAKVVGGHESVVLHHRRHRSGVRGLPSGDQTAKRSTTVPSFGKSSLGSIVERETLGIPTFQESCAAFPGDDASIDPITRLPCGGPRIDADRTRHR